jgi:choline transporter-like protein 2/4/5
MRYHTGTAALGSLLLALIDTVRQVLSFIQNRLKKAPGDNAITDSTNVIDVVCCCTNCLLCCIRRCIEIANRGAYIHCALFGTGFCYSAVSAATALISNAPSAAMLTLVSGIVLGAGRLLISGSVTLVAYAILSAREADSNDGNGGSVTVDLQLQSGVCAPTFVTAMLAWTVAREFCAVYDMAINTIMHCHFVHKNRVDGGHDHGPLMKRVSTNMAVEREGQRGKAGAVGKVHIEAQPPSLAAHFHLPPSREAPAFVLREGPAVAPAAVPATPAQVPVAQVPVAQVAQVQ